MGVKFKVYFHEQLRKKTGHTKSELSIRKTDVKEVLERICDIALELNSEHAELLKKFRELAERTLKFLQERVNLEVYSKSKVVKDLLIWHKKVCERLKINIYSFFLYLNLSVNYG